tara:strand:+ start:349 stop:612 length:264 start_codon:yes stop_codon:yes gene_type:complete
MAEESINTGSPTITLDDTTYEINGLSDKSKELLGLYQQAQQDMVKLRRDTVIAEIAVNSLTQMVAQSIKEEKEEAPADESTSGGSEV